ncbi:MAG: cell wall-binding repeat-containing protein, partial [Acidimicrobiales bacterium]
MPLAMVAIVGSGLVVGTSSTATATANVSASRLFGPDRFATAVNIAEAKFPNGVSTVVLASGLSFADALAGAYLAGLGAVAGATGPAGILLTLPGSVPSSLTAGLS